MINYQVFVVMLNLAMILIVMKLLLEKILVRFWDHNQNQNQPLEFILCYNYVISI